MKIEGCARDFCLDTTIHGFNHIAVPGRHWLERVLWAGITVAAIWGAVDISLGQLARYNDNPTVVTLEKDFRSWYFNMPAITTCDQNRVNPKKIDEVLKIYFNVDSHDDKYDYYKSFVTVVANSDLQQLENYKEFVDDELLAKVDLYQLAVDVLPKFQAKATWSHGIDVNWNPVMTESGVCYGTNSLATADVNIVKLNPNDTKNFPLTCKYSSQRCYVLLEITSNATFYTHSPYDIVDAMGPKSVVYLSLDRSVELTVIETECGKGIRDLTPQRRRCLYTNEPQRSGGQVYSTNTCRLSCRAKLAVRLCGCRPFFYPREDGPQCTPKGMFCLAEHTMTLLTNGGVKCSCSPQCQDAVYRDVATVEQIWGKGQFADRGSMRYTVQAPRSRYTREIVFHFQDLVVSFGGAAGLFLGASFISFVEIFYFLVMRAVRFFIKEDTKKDSVKVLKKPVTIPFEAARIVELNKVLESQERYGF
ncbi:pickpocket protein 28 [Amyelois transitella]|uniref:pickpocket protein 28 n=1 Tax=Amyelois transitella TaxID=680683 RepID=UPI00298F9732|nr:pickpocket protein 28 [Amyelois transitella]